MRATNPLLVCGLGAKLKVDPVACPHCDLIPSPATLPRVGLTHPRAASGLHLPLWLPGSSGVRALTPCACGTEDCRAGWGDGFPSPQPALDFHQGIRPESRQNSLGGAEKNGDNCVRPRPQSRGLQWSPWGLSRD